VIVPLLSASVAADTTGAAKLVSLMLDGHPVDGVPLTAGRQLAVGAIALTTNVLVFTVLSCQLPCQIDRKTTGSGGVLGRSVPSGHARTRHRTGGSLGSSTTCISHTRIWSRSALGRFDAEEAGEGPMASQSMIALAVTVVVISRVINILPTPSG
jgi:hypothetical protein